MLDLDNFKVINDTYGHKAGDAVIRKFSSDIRQALRKDDWIAKFGGDRVYYLATECGSTRRHSDGRALAL